MICFCFCLSKFSRHSSFFFRSASCIFFSHLFQRGAALVMTTCLGNFRRRGRYFFMFCPNSLSFFLEVILRYHRIFRRAQKLSCKRVWAPETRNFAKFSSITLQHECSNAPYLQISYSWVIDRNNENISIMSYHIYMTSLKPPGRSPEWYFRIWQRRHLPMQYHKEELWSQALREMSNCSIERINSAKNRISRAEALRLHHSILFSIDIYSCSQFPTLGCFIHASICHVHVCETNSTIMAMKNIMRI